MFITIERWVETAVQRVQIGLAWAVSTALGSFWLGSIPAREDPPQPPTLLAAFTVPGVEPKAADADAPLAEGWPKATQPGVIEVKAFPGYRGAVACGKNATMGADTGLFSPLFLHISRSNVEMTAPVINTYEPVMLDKPGSTGDVAMEFVLPDSPNRPTWPGERRCGRGRSPGGFVRLSRGPGKPRLSQARAGDLDAPVLARCASHEMGGRWQPPAVGLSRSDGG